MYISYDYYRIFYYVARYGSISKAASVLMNNQPNLTRTIKNLEGELGCPLFSRTNRGVKLTPEGKRLYEHIKIAFEQIEAGEAEIVDSKSLQNGSVYISASEVALHCCLLPIFKKYRALYPNIRLHVSNHSTPQAIEALKEGLVDFAIVSTPTVKSTNLEEITVRKFQEVLISSNAYKELKDKIVSLADLTDYPLISLSSQTKTFDFYSKLYDGYGLAYVPDIEAATADQILPMVRSDLGLGFVPEDFIKGVNDIFTIKTTEKIPMREICLIKRKGQLLSMAAKEFEKMMLEPI